ncbi:trypsin-like serine peptidase [Rhizobium leguminosarum]|uniref:trypsin-like serine peptidase n=1 Tax=Rhizobium leguminosarum TaxID=384 RepID=UPI00102FF88D|nr:hypothetical protein [Rhizobium leguminosarum]TAX37061.1 hypothetical protein ELI06_23315 [Rhizobium leguminosarum]
MRKIVLAAILVASLTAAGTANSQDGGGGFGGSDGGPATIQSVTPTPGGLSVTPFEQGGVLPQSSSQAVDILSSSRRYTGDEDFGIPLLHHDWVPGEQPIFTFDPSNCFDCQPADPEIGMGSVMAIAGVSLSNRLNEAVSAKLSGQPSETLTGINRCGSAVQLLRSPTDFGNMIDDFREGCLKPSEGTYKSLSEAAQQEISQCLATHTLYEDSCLQDTDTIENKLIVARVGMLFNDSVNGIAEPACTATLISETLIVTARHCYLRAALKLPASYTSPNGNAALVYAVNPLLGIEAPSRVAVLGEVTGDGLTDVALLDSYPDTPEDMIVLKLAKPVPLENPKLEIRWGVAATGAELTLVGFQELSFRNALLKERVSETALTETTDLLFDRSFIKFIKVDHGPMCIVGYREDGQFGHYCQSFGGTSGAPIFLNDLSAAQATNTVTIVGFQSRGNASDAADKETLAPTNTAAQINESVAGLLGLP